MRGKHSDGLPLTWRDGITPADAGKTSSSYHAMRRSRDHPRGCGENSLLMQGSCDDAGSPPRMRGKLSVGSASAITDGITPADAGKTLPVPPRGAEDQDHPRGCGENLTR